MAIVREFQEFIARGNVMDLAVGVIIGGAFQKIVDSLVKDMLMPVLGKLLGGVDFKHLYRAPRKTSTRPPLVNLHRSESAPSRLR